MPVKLKIHWAVWCLLSCITFVEALNNYLIESVTIPIQLKEGASIQTSVFRTFDDTLRVSLKFYRTDYSDGGILGEWKRNINQQKEGMIRFVNPGEQILLEITNGTEKVIYEALPGNGVNSYIISWRDFVPYVHDGDNKTFPWPPKHESWLKLCSGITDLTVSVVGIGNVFNNKDSSLLIESPIGFKACSKNYQIFWWFIFWPVYAVLLFVYGLILVKNSIDLSKRVN